jgi:hypothetical protein
VTSLSPARLQDVAPPVPDPSPAGFADGGDVVVIPKRGLKFTRQPSFERWLSVGRQLSDIHTSSAWCLGDWLVFGEAAYHGRYRDAIEQTSLDYQTLRNYAWVARRFALSRRRDSLSFGHHAEVAALPDAEQGFWLRKAEEHGWSVKRLRREVHTSLAERGSADDSESDGATGMDDPDPRHLSRGPLVRVHVRITPQQLETCRTAADKAGLTVEAWAALALDHVARQGLATAETHTRDLVAGSRVALISIFLASLSYPVYRGTTDQDLRYRAQHIPAGGPTTSLMAVVTDVIRAGRPSGRLRLGLDRALCPERTDPGTVRAPPTAGIAAGGHHRPREPRSFRAWTVTITGEKPGGHGGRCVAVGTLDMALRDAAAMIAGAPSR